MPDINDLLTDAQSADERLEAGYRDCLIVNPDLDRRLVSFQASKAQAESRWFKYKEGFSPALMRYLFEQADLRTGQRILDPFVGSGTALFSARAFGLDAVGIELLPSSVEAAAVRHLLLTTETVEFAAKLRDFASAKSWGRAGKTTPFSHLVITAGAFPHETEHALGRYLWEAAALPDPILSRVLRFAALCVLEQISYTRKDGQYLRWDYRAGRRVGAKPFNKGRILSFDEAITTKLNEIADDMSAESEPDQITSPVPGRIEVLAGSCLDLLPTLETASFDGLITSPPYCNRYDYTRTYALELAFFGVDEAGVRQMRQDLLSCTVENKEKTGQEEKHSAALFQAASEAFKQQEALGSIVRYLEACRASKTINNASIPRMVQN